MLMNMKSIKIKYEDQNIIVIDKPAGLVVHPGAGNETDTLVDWLKSKYPDVVKRDWPDLTRPGIIHRLDKDTSGLMILAKNPRILLSLQKEFQKRKITKKYNALVFGKLEKPEGEISGFISRDPNARRQQTAKNIHFDFQPGKVREAKTQYKVLKEYNYHNQILSLIEATIETGRTHQIRIHFKSIGNPVIGDQTYNIKHSRNLSNKLGLTRQFLHSYKLEFNNHRFESNIAKDLDNVLKMIG